MKPPFEKPDNLPDHLSTGRRAQLRALLLEYEVTMLSTVYWRNLPPWRLAERRSIDSFFLFPVKGVLRLYCDGQHYRVPPGQFLMIRDHCPHAIELEVGHDALEQISVHALFQNAWQIPLLSWFATPVGTLGDPETVFEQLKTLACLMAREPAAAQVFGGNLLRQLMIEQLLSRDDITAPDNRVDPRIARSLQTIQERFGSALTVEQLAASVDLSEVQFRKLFRRETGQAPQAYLQTLRIRQAAQALRHTAAPISRIARNCGFSTPQYFHQCFRQEYHCTPTDYRRAARGSV